MMLLAMLLVVMKLLRFEIMRHVHLHPIPSVGGSAIHHGMLPLLMTLIIHAEEVVSGGLGSRGSGGRWSVVRKGCVCTSDLDG